MDDAHGVGFGVADPDGRLTGYGHGAPVQSSMVNHPRRAEDWKITGRCDSVTVKLGFGEYRITPLEPTMKTLALLLLVATSLTAADLKWETSLEAAQKRARAEHKQIFMAVGTGWCGWCRKLEKDTFPSPQAQAFLAKMVALDVQTQDAKGQPTPENYIEAKYRPEGFPTLYILDADGKTIASQAGYLGPQDFVNWMAQHAGK
jgi:thioredoxin-related protein